ncbi:alpha/beta hydrolase fold domain-containing protein [Deinococcus antarcticus]|uniref:Alpha/beta hydrolase fold domain-containing protein n=1 Tax=Deinococcus antarcticus TaxID=1298767 RepID=A0ABV8A3D2_9DEIO
MYPADFPPDDLELTEGIEFSAHGLKLDLLRPRTTPEHPVPALVHLHGGAWMMYSRWAVDNIALARAGFVTVSVDYRLAPAATFPAQLHDAKTAVRWLRAHAADLDINPDRIGAWGISAGGHLASLLGTTAGLSELEGEEGGWSAFSSDVQAVANVCGPTNLLGPGFPDLDKPFLLLGGTLREKGALAQQASPVTHLTPDAPPFFLLHGKQDREVPIAQSREMLAALRDAGVPATLLELEGDHYINDTHRTQMNDALTDFFGRTLNFSPNVVHR